MKIKKLDLFKFKKKVDKNEPFIVKFKSDQCYICKEIEPVYEEVAKSIPELKFYDIDVDDEEDLADLFLGDGVPTLFYIKGPSFKELEYPMNGYTKENLTEIIQKELAKEEK